MPLRLADSRVLTDASDTSQGSLAAMKLTFRTVSGESFQVCALPCAHYVVPCGQHPSMFACMHSHTRACVG